MEIENKSIIFIILDGWGYGPAWGGNAIAMADTPNFNNFWKNYPHSILKASGRDVGLPGHERGNSEVGHLNLGSGRIVWQDNTKINKTIENGSFFGNPVLYEAVCHAQKHKSRLHLMGLVSDGNVHSHINHLFALLELCKKYKIEDVFIHAFTDGRDTAPMSATQYIFRLEQKIKKMGFSKIATVSGRYYAMDRDNHWGRTEKAYLALTEGEGEQAASALEAVANAYKKNLSDEFILPTVIMKNGKPLAKIQDNDAVIFFNFRSDRARQITESFIKKDFHRFSRKTVFKHLFFVGFVPFSIEYEQEEGLKPAFKTENIINVLAEVLSRNNLKQLHLAETEKYAHVTYFFNGGREEPFPGEERLLIPSQYVPTYDLKPEMSAPEIAENLIKEIKERKYDFIVANFANPDMVGHSGNFKAVVKAVETIDKLMGQISKTILEKNAILIITADHGNAEQMVHPTTGEKDTEHTTSPVPFHLISSQGKNFNLRPDGILADVAPTILKLMGIEQPKEMTGSSLLEV